MIRDQSGGRHIRHATVDAGQSTRADVDLPVGSLSVEARVATDQGSAVPLAQVALVSPAMSGDSMETLLDHTLDADVAAVIYRRRGADPSFVFDALVPGAYSACAGEVPLDLSNVASVGAPLLETLPLRCTAVTLTESGTLTLAVPGHVRGALPH
jgi:hypothetical protein